MSVSHLCKNCGVGRVRPFHFSIDQAIVQCDNADCDSFLDSSPWNCVIKQKIIPPEKRQLVVCDSEDYKNWSYSSSEPVLDSRSPAVYSSDLCFNLPFGVLTLPKESEVVERTFCDSKYIADTVDRYSTNNCTFLDLLCDIDSGIETQILGKENLSVSNNDSDLKWSTNLDSWMEAYKFNDFVNNKTSKERDNPNTNIQVPVVDQVLASNEDFFVSQMQSELLPGKQTKSSNYYEPQKLDSCVDKRGETFYSKQSFGASVVNAGSEYNEDMSKIMPTIKEENFKSLIEGNLESTNTSSKAGQNTLRYNFTDIVCEESMLTSLDTFSIITHSVSTAESKEGIDKQVLNEDPNTEHNSFKIVTNELHKDTGMVGTSRHEPSTLNLNINENAVEEPLWSSSNPLGLMPKDDTEATAIQSAVDSSCNGLDKYSIGDLADEDSSQNICLSTVSDDEGKASCSEPTTSSLSPKLDDSTLSVQENANNVFKNYHSRGRGRTKGRSRGRGRGRGSHKYSKKCESSCINQLEEKVHASHQGQRRERTSKVNEVVPRQTRQRTGTLEVQAPRSVKRPFEAPQDPTATSLRSGISSLLQGPSWMIHENGKKGNHNITNLSCRSLLNGSAEDPWSVPEFSLEGLDIEIIVQGLHSKSPREDSNENSTVEGRGTAQVKESSLKSEINNQHEISATHSLLTEDDNTRRDGEDKQSKLCKGDIEFENLSNKKGESMQSGNISCSDFENHFSVVVDERKSSRFSLENSRSMQEQYRSAAALESTGNVNVNHMSYVTTCQISEDHTKDCYTVNESSELKDASNENKIKCNLNVLETSSKAGEENIEVGVLESNDNVLNCNSQKDVFSNNTCISDGCSKNMLIEESLVKIEFQDDIRTAIVPDSATNVSDVIKEKHNKSCGRSIDIFKTGICLDPFKAKGPEFIATKKQRTQGYDESHKELIDASIRLGYMHSKSELMLGMKDTTESADLLPHILCNTSPNYWLVLPKNDEIRTWLGCKEENRSEGLVNISDSQLCESETTTDDHLNGPCEVASSTYFSTILEGLSFDETFFQCPSNEHPENTFVEHLSSSLFFGETADKSSETKQCPSFLSEKLGGKYGESDGSIIDSISDCNSMKGNTEAAKTNVYNIGISSKEGPVPTKSENELFAENIACTLEGNVKIPYEINFSEENKALGAEISISNEDQSTDMARLPSASPLITKRMKISMSELGSEFCSSVKDELIEIKNKKMRFTTEDQEVLEKTDLRTEKCKHLSLQPDLLNLTKTEDSNTNTNNVSIKSNMFLCIQEKKMSDESNDEIPIVSLDSDNDLQIIVPEKAKKEKNKDSNHYDISECKQSLEDASFDFSSKDQTSEDLNSNSQGDSFLTCGIFDNSVPHDKKCYSPNLKVFVDFEDNYGDIIPRKIKSYYSKKTSQDICKNLNISFNHSDSSDKLDNASCLTVPVLSPSDVSHTDIITAIPGFGCTKFSPQHGIVESVRNKEMSSLDEFPSLFLSDEIACEEPSLLSSYSSEYLRNVDLQKSESCSVSYTDLDLCNRYKGIGKKDHEIHQPMIDNNTQNQTSTLFERIEQSGVIVKDVDCLKTDISSRATCSGKDALVCVPSNTNSLDIPVVPVIPINEAVKNRITELSLASEISNTFSLNSTSGVKSNNIVHQNILTEDSTNQPHKSHNLTVAKVSNNLLSAPVSIPVTQVVDFTEKVNILCKPNMFMGVSGRNAHIDYKMPLKEQRPVLIPPALATSYEEEKVSNSHVTHKESLESIVAVTTHTSSGPVTRLLRVNTLSKGEMSKDEHCVKEVKLDRCSIDTYLMKKEEKMEDDLGTELRHVKLVDQNSDEYSEEKKNSDPVNSMIKKVRMGSKGGFYLRPSPALMNAIAELRSKKNFDTESKTNLDKPDVIKLPDGTPIAHPIYLQSKNALKKQTCKRKYEGIHYCTDQLVKEKVLDTMERSRTDKDIPEMVAVCVHGKLHIYCRNDLN